MVLSSTYRLAPIRCRWLVADTTFNVTGTFINGINNAGVIVGFLSDGGQRERVRGLRACSINQKGLAVQRSLKRRFIRGLRGGDVPIERRR
jgi:hypothetical protein